MSDEIHLLAQDDVRWLKQAELHIQQLLRNRYGDVTLAHTEADLALAQRAIDDGAVGRGDELELQCLGVLLGNVFTANTSMKWARVDNEFGNMLALHDDKIKFTLYPLTMISNRMEDQRKIDFVALYRSFVNDLYAS
jgi:hypothetical protein